MQARRITAKMKKHVLKLARKEWGEDKRPPQSLYDAFAELQTRQETVELNWDPWLIAFSQPRVEHVAKASLEREGFECYYPVGKHVTTPPMRTLPSKTRHKRRYEVREEARPVLRSYLFIRRLFGGYDLDNLYELNGVGGICHFGDYVATLPDYEIELLRLAEGYGRFNTYNVSNTGAYRLAVATLADHPDPRSKWTGQTRMIGRLDESDRTIQFIESVGRVIRVIQTAQQLPATR